MDPNKTGISPNHLNNVHTPQTHSIPDQSISLNTTFNNTKINNSSTTSISKNAALNLDPNSTSQNNPNFADVTATTIFPKRDQAIVFNSIDGIPQIEYLMAISKIIPATDIKFASRISNNRFCIFLATKKTAEALVDKHPIIKINNNNSIHIRKLINPAKRIILSNVCPSIPHHKITEELNKLGISPTSQITFIKAGKNEGFDHIFSFRRQLYIKHEEVHKLPGSLIINHVEIQFRIFVTDDTITCYLCKSAGHTSTSCPSKLNTPLITDLDEPKNQIQNNTVHEFNEPLKKSVNASKVTPMVTGNQHETLNTILHTQAINKRPAPSSSCPSSPLSQSSNMQTSNATVKNTEKPKKLKKTSSVENFIENLSFNMEPTKTYFEENPQLPIDYFQTMSFIENAINAKNFVEMQSIAKKYTNDIDTLASVIQEIHTFITDRSCKYRLTMLYKKLTSPSTQY